jgi:ABC-2 type transport system permease protein
VRFFRDRARVVSSLVQPILFWVLFAAALRNASFAAGGRDFSSVGYGEFFFVGTLTMIVLFTAIFATITVIEDRLEGFLQGVLVAPVPRAAIALGKIGGGATIALLQAMVFLAMAPVAGVPVSLRGAMLAVLALALLAVALTGLGFTLAWLLDSTAGYHGIMMVFLLPMWLLSGSMFPLQSAHPVLAAVMRLDPLTYGVAAVRYALYGTGAEEVAGLPSPSLSWAVTAAFAAGALALGTAVVARRSVRNAR